LRTSRYRLLVVDVDGTLISNDGNISRENQEAISLVKNAGIHISLCTGRTIVSCQRYIEQLGLDGYHIYFDGALVSRPDLDETVYIQTLERDIVRQMIEFARKHDINLELGSVTQYFSERETWSTDMKRRLFDVDAIIGDLTGLWDREEIIRADIVITDAEVEAKSKAFMDHFSGRLGFISAHTPRLPDVYFLNITASGLSKGKALEALASHLDMPLEETVAVGDWINDIPLITTAGLGIAMGNAHEELKKVADHVTLDVEENGLAAALKEFVI
jgi:Cof subfamily protein (haloacid dehalogenase superfamily)